MDVDSSAALPAVHSPRPAGSAPGPVVGGETVGLRIPPPIFGTGLNAALPEARSGEPVAGGHFAPKPAQSGAGRDSARMPEGGSGITGGRPVPAPQGRASSGIPKGTVVGAGETGGPGATRAPVTGFGPAGQAAGQPGAMPGRRSMAPRSGVSGGSRSNRGVLPEFVPYRPVRMRVTVASRAGGRSSETRAAEPMAGGGRHVIPRRDVRGVRRTERGPATSSKTTRPGYRAIHALCRRSSTDAFRKARGYSCHRAVFGVGAAPLRYRVCAA